MYRAATASLENRCRAISRKKLAQLNPPGVVHREYVDRCAPDCGNPFDNRSSAAEMIGPGVTPWIKKGDKLPGDRIDAGPVRAFAEIAAVAGKRQVAGIVGPTVLPGDYVLDVVRKSANVLRKQAVFATVRGLGADEFPRGRIHHY
jgi:hypothetical protein